MEPAVRRKAALAWWKALLAPWMLAVIAGAFFYAGPARDFMVPAAARIVFFHVPVAVLLIVWFLVAAVFSILLLRKGDLGYDRRAAAAAEVGLICTILATVSGSVFARIQWRTWWNWDPKQIAIVVVLFAYLAYFALRAEMDDEERRARVSAVYAIIAGVAAPFLLKGIQYLPGVRTLHPPAVLQPGGMSGDYWLVFWGSLIGFLGITAWMYELRLRVAEAAERVTQRECDDVRAPLPVA
jgi:heme exporter protein C